MRTQGRYTTFHETLLSLIYKYDILEPHVVQFLWLFWLLSAILTNAWLQGHPTCSLLLLCFFIWLTLYYCYRQMCNNTNSKQQTVTRTTAWCSFWASVCLNYPSRFPGGSIRRPERLHCWSGGSCDPASWPPRLWPPRRSFEPEVAPWRCSTSPGPLWPEGGCRKLVVPPLWRQEEIKPSLTVEQCFIWCCM